MRFKLKFSCSFSCATDSAKCPSCKARQVASHQVPRVAPPSFRDERPFFPFQPSIPFQPVNPTQPVIPLFFPVFPPENNQPFFPEGFQDFQRRVHSRRAEAARDLYRRQQYDYRRRPHAGHSRTTGSISKGQPFSSANAHVAQACRSRSTRTSTTVRPPHNQAYGTYQTADLCPPEPRLSPCSFADPPPPYSKHAPAPIFLRQPQSSQQSYDSFSSIGARFILHTFHRDYDLARQAKVKHYIMRVLCRMGSLVSSEHGVFGALLILQRISLYRPSSQFASFLQEGNPYLLFLLALMTSERVILDQTITVKSFHKLAPEGLISYREFNRLDRLVLQHLQWDCTIPDPMLSAFEARVYYDFAPSETSFGTYSFSMVTRRSESSRYWI
ncbi:hypothetical protein Hypma_006231 [Hypsizygus marmoreus]|uniref:Cyclin N-terminal domain-containing protein n=1 Tax=Hypsizygus marmoreus TaxID=39966 RepID=A0A369K133_HYPMA|nr:hypothetical protein Hypma_006231 [Hypsizygus marmoreus]